MTEAALIHELILTLTPAEDPSVLECKDSRVKDVTTHDLTIRIDPIPRTTQRVRMYVQKPADLPDYRRSVVASSSYVGEARVAWELDAHGARSPEFDIGRDVDVLVVVVTEAASQEVPPKTRPVQRRFKIRYQGGEGRFSDG